MKISSLFILLSTSVFGQNITSYKPLTGYGICHQSSKEIIILRRFLKGADTYYLTVSPQSLITKVIPSDSITVSRASWSQIESRYSGTPYIKAVTRAEGYGNPLQDAGIRHFMPSKKGIDLTIDLCPSNLPLERIIFTDLIKEIGVVEKPVPLAVSVTGIWINEHPGDFRWLDSLDRTGELSIVWINHSYHHRTYRNTPLSSNFMLAPGTDINSEVLNTEILLLKNNIVPSVFFRFPGLVSDREIYDKILSLGLIPVGSDAWLAKGQWPKDGSIVLIHANGNEPLGVKEFIQLLKMEQKEVTARRWELFDLRESIVDENE